MSYNRTNKQKDKQKLQFYLGSYFENMSWKDIILKNVPKLKKEKFMKIWLYSIQINNSIARNMMITMMIV